MYAVTNNLYWIHLSKYSQNRKRKPKQKTWIQTNDLHSPGCPKSRWTAVLGGRAGGVGSDWSPLISHLPESDSSSLVSISESNYPKDTRKWCKMTLKTRITPTKRRTVTTKWCLTTTKTHKTTTNRRRNKQRHAKRLQTTHSSRFMSPSVWVSCSDGVGGPFMSLSWSPSSQNFSMSVGHL